MKEFINNLQNQPKNKKLLILWVSTATVMILIIVIWLFFFSKNTEKEFRNSKTEDFPSLFESIKKDFSVFKEVIGASIQQRINSETEAQENEIETK